VPTPNLRPLALRKMSSRYGIPPFKGGIPSQHEVNDLLLVMQLEVGKVVIDGSNPVATANYVK